jgi:hypothetical protein
MFMDLELECSVPIISASQVSYLFVDLLMYEMMKPIEGASSHLQQGSIRMQTFLILVPNFQQGHWLIDDLLIIKHPMTSWS